MTKRVVKTKRKISTPKDILDLREAARTLGLDYFELIKKGPSEPVMLVASEERAIIMGLIAWIENMGYDAGTTATAYRYGGLDLEMHVRCKHNFLGKHLLTEYESAREEYENQFPAT